MDIVLLPGLALPHRAWDDVVAALAEMGHRGVPVLLPGQGDGNRMATLDDQVAAVLLAVDHAQGKPLVVGHSAASTLAWIAADSRSEHVAGVVMIGFPKSDGDLYADYFPIVDGVVPFPGWEAFEATMIADLDVATLERLAAEWIPVPEGVSRGMVHLKNNRRYDVPVTLVCPEFSSSQAQVWIDAGTIPDLRLATHLDLVDIASGHLPMLTQPRVLAELLARAATC